MKKNLLKEYEALIREHMEKLYQNAYRVRGNKQEAEILTEDTIVFGAKKYGGLANKARIIDIMMQKIGEGSHDGFEPCDTEAILSRAIGKIKSRGKAQNLLAAVCAGILAISTIAFTVVPNLNFEPESTTTPTTTATDAEGEVILPVIGAVTMKDTKTIKGDNQVVSFENYHNLSKTLKKNTTPNTIGSDIYSEIERYCASVKAPDGTVYMAFNHINKEDIDDITFDLYRMETDGWNKVAEGETQVMHDTGIYSNYFASRIHMIADEDSNIYVFVLLDDAVTVYRYDSRTGKFTKSDALLPARAPTPDTTFYVYYDEAFGEHGGVYVGYYYEDLCHFACYDIAKDEYVNIAENIDISAPYMTFCAQDGVIHMVTQSHNSIDYYRIESDGTYESTTLTLGALYGDSERIVNRNAGAGGIFVDNNGNAHVLMTRHEYDAHIYCIVHYTIASDATFEKETLPKLYYVDTDSYSPMCIGGFTDDDGNIYYIEKYKAYATDSMNILAIGRLDENGGATCVDVLELPNAITRGGSRLMNQIITFYSDNDIYYFTIDW